MTKTMKTEQNAELNEAIVCYEEELNDLRKNKIMSVAEKIMALKQMATMLNQEEIYLYQ